MLAIAGAMVAGMAFAFAGYAIGASHPALASAAFRGSVILPLAIGGGVSAGAIWLVAVATAMTGADASPWLAAGSTAVVGIVGVLADRARALNGLAPSATAEKLVRSRYASAFPKLHGADTAAYHSAYNALHRDPTGDAQGTITGWGFQATTRRLTLVRTGLR